MHAAPKVKSHTTRVCGKPRIHRVSHLVSRHDLEPDHPERGHGERRPEPGTPKRPAERPHFPGGARALRAQDLCLARGALLTGRRIPIEQRERHRRGRDDSAEGDECRAPTQRGDEPGVHRIERDGAPRVARTEHSHRGTARPHEPTRHDRRRRDEDAGNTRGAEDAEAQVVLRERGHLARESKGHTERQPADRHDRAHSPAVVEPARHRREDHEAKPAQRVAERGRAASPRELLQDRDIEEGERGPRPPCEGIHSRGRADHHPSVRPGPARGRRHPVSETGRSEGPCKARMNRLPSNYGCGLEHRGRGRAHR